MPKDKIDTSNVEFANVSKLINETSSSIFLTGKAGTGKSTFLRYIVDHTKKKCVVLAPTGIASINAGGMTIHSFFKLPFRPLLPSDPDLAHHNGRIFDFFKYKKDQVKLIEETNLFIIDEISMVRADIIDAIDRILRVYTGNMRLPFGGKQLLLVGDVFQLEPVVTNDTRDILKPHYSSPFFFSARVFLEIKLISIELRKVYRQSDPMFVGLLDSVRQNKLDKQGLSLLNARYEQEEQNKFNIILACRRDVVDLTNEQRLKDLEGISFQYTGKILNEFPESNLPTELELYLKVGAQIMFVKNDPEKRWYNGSIGEILCLDADHIRVLLESGIEYEIERETWDNIRYSYDAKKKVVVEDKLGSFTQYPIKLAWAITIHKSQGLTFENITIDLGRGAFAGGQTYVALSRCRTLDGISLKQKIQSSDIFINQQILQFSKEFNDEQLVHQSLTEAQSNQHFHNSLIYFKKNNFTKAISELVKGNNINNKLSNSTIQRFIAHQLNKINHQKNTIKELEKKLLKQSIMTRGIAKEFFYLAKENIKLNELIVAKANLNKALILDPEYVDALILNGQLLYNSNNYEEALSFFTAALQIEPHNFRILFGRGRTFTELKRPDFAIDDLQKALTLKPEHSKCKQALGDAYSKNGDILNAMKYWET